VEIKVYILRCALEVILNVFMVLNIENTLILVLVRNVFISNAAIA